MKIQKLFIAFFVLVSLASCSNKPSLQKYFVEHEAKDNFTIVDIPKGILKIDESKLNEKQKRGYESIKKINLLAYPLTTGDVVTYKAEKEVIKNLLKDEEYTSLMRMSSSGGKVWIKSLGNNNEKTVDEMIIFGYKDDLGLGIARVLGDNMRSEDLFKLYEAMDQASVDDSQIKGFMELFK